MENKFDNLEQLFLERENIENKLKNQQYLQRHKNGFMLALVNMECTLSIPEILQKEIIEITELYFINELNTINYRIQTEINNLSTKEPCPTSLHSHQESD